MYTTGEWTSHKMYSGFGTETYQVLNDYGYELARVFIHNGEQEANAKLIAQSPRMFELLKKLVDIGWNTDDENYEDVQAIIEDAYQIIHTLATVEK